MMSWWSGLDEAAALTAFVFVPGVLVGWVLGLRRVLLLVAAPALSVAILALAPVLLAPLGIAWTPLTAALSTAVVAAAFAALRWACRRSWRVATEAGPAVWPVLLAVVVALPFATIPLKNGMGSPDYPPQTWDAIFHLNGLRAILDTGDGSALHLGRLSKPAGDVVFYPAGWHDVAVLAVHGDPVVTANVFTLVLAAVLWPLALAGLAAVVAPRSRVAPVAAALAGTALVAFPARMVSYGTLWPNALGYVLVPTALALTVVVLERLRRRRTQPRSPWPVSEAIVLAAALGGAGLAHPNADLAYVVLAAPLALAYWWEELCAARRQGGAWRWAAVVAAPLVVLAGAWLSRSLFVATKTNTRLPYGGGRDAVIGAFTDAQLSAQGFGNPERSYLLGALVVLGMVATVLLRRNRWLAVGMLTTTALFTVAVNPTLPGSFLVRPWYSDPVRLGGMVAIVSPVLVGVAVAWLGQVAARRVRLRNPAGRPVIAEGVAAALVLVLVVGTGGLRGQLRTEQLQTNYVMVPESGLNGLVGPEELAMIERADEELPDDAVVLGNPFTGAPLLYAVSDVKVVYPHLSGTWGTDAKVLAKSFDEIRTNPAVCAALDDLGVDYLYTDGLLYWPTHEDVQDYRGLLDTDPAVLGDALEPVDTGGSATLYRITACD
jgi:hypothetical protein